MLDFISTIISISASNVPSIFVVSGLYCGYQSIFPPKPGTNRKLLAIFGSVLVILGIIFFFLQFLNTNNNIGRQGTATPIATPTVLPTQTTTQINDTPGEMATPIAITVITLPVGQHHVEDDSIVLSRCRWLQLSMPTIQDILTQQSGISFTTMKLLRLGCGDIVDGIFISSNNIVEISIPDGACVDATTDAQFNGQVEAKDWGIRAYSGTVRHTSFAYYPWCDERYHVPLNGSG